MSLCSGSLCSGRRSVWAVVALVLGVVASACASAPSTSSPETSDAPPPTTVTSALQDTTSSSSPPVTAAPSEEAPSEEVSAAEALPEVPFAESLFPASPLPQVGADLEGALLGVSTGLSRAERAPRFTQLETDAARQFDIGHVFHSWDTAIPTEDDLFHLEAGRILMISWNGTDTIEIQDGQHDDWIRQQAEAVRDLGQPVLLRWLWEMDGRRRIEWVHSPEDFVGAWLQVRSIFDEVGADNAQFVWCPNEFLFWEDGGAPDAWYPGDDHVDWLCADGYNWADSTESPEWVTPEEIFGDFVEWAAPRNKPIIIGETSTNEGEPGAKGEWFAELPEILQRDLPEIDGVVFFDKDFREFGHNDWRVDTSASAYEGWLSLTADPWFNPLGP